MNNMKKEGEFSNKNRNYLCIIAAILVVLIAITIVKEQNFNGTQNDPKLVKSVYIEAGDTLWSIAKENLTGDYTVKELVDEIVQINCLIDPNTIHEGRYILVPYYEE